MKPSVKQLLVDVDRTIFDTGKFIIAAWQAIAKVYGVDANKQLSNLEANYVYNNIGDQNADNTKKLRYYDFGAHIETVTGKPRDEVVAAIQPELKTQNFVYPDVATLLELVKADPNLELSFVTFEIMWFQLIKRQQVFNIMPQLNKFNWHVVQEPKGPYIARTFPGSSGWLVDDKQEALPAGYQLLWLQRDNVEAIINNSGNITINSLSVIKEAIKL